MARRIPPHKVDEIYAAADIVEVVGEYVTLKKRGSNYFGLSPWSNEKTPSFAVSPSKGIYKDFSSGKGGNAVSFLMELEGMTYAEALLHLAKKYGIQVEVEETPEDSFRDDVRESLYILNEFAAKYFHQQLLENETGRRVALTYFKERGILESTLADFMLGYAPDEWDNFVKEAQRNQFNDDYIVQTGLAFRSEKDGRLLDRFKGRIIFPIHNHLGKIAGFGGRIIGKQENVAKYINSPETEIYNKSRILYGLWQGRQAIREKNICILCEGYMDVISLHQNGIRNAVASSGTALTEDQIKMIKRYTRNVMLIYDADKAGINAALRGVDLLLQNEMVVRVLLLPEGHDPDSFVQEQGKTGFEEYLASKSADFIDFKISRLMQVHNITEPQGKSAIIRETAETIAHIADPVQQAVYTEMAASRIGIPLEVMKAALGQGIQAKEKLDRRNKNLRETGTITEAPPPEEQTLPQVVIEKDAQEKELLRLMLNYHDRNLMLEDEEVNVIKYVLDEMDELTFTTDWLEEIRREIISNWERKGAPDVHRLINHPNTEISSLVSFLVSIPGDEVSEHWSRANLRMVKMDDNLEKSLEDAVDHFKAKYLLSLLNEINQFKNRTLSEAEQIQYLKKQMVLNELKMELAKKRGAAITVNHQNIFQNPADFGPQPPPVSEMLGKKKKENKKDKN